MWTKLELSLRLRSLVAVRTGSRSRENYAKNVIFSVRSHVLIMSCHVIIMSCPTSSGNTHNIRCGHKHKALHKPSPGTNLVPAESSLNMWTLQQIQLQLYFCCQDSTLQLYYCCQVGLYYRTLGGKRGCCHFISPVMTRNSLINTG